jgi:hypothetical protein
MTAVPDIMQALADQIDDSLSVGTAGTAVPVIENLQITPLLNINPTPPSIDIYPADPFQEGLAYGLVNEMRFLVRVRVTTADHEAGQTLLLTMMDPTATTSLGKAIASDRTLSNKVSSLSVEGPSGFGIYRDASGEGSLLGAVWTVRLFP